MRHRIALLPAALMAGLPIGEAIAEPFTLLIFENDRQLAKRTETGPEGLAYWQSYADFAKRAGEAGILRGGAALHARQNVVSVTVSGGQPVTAAAFDAGAELSVSGFFQIDVENEQKAIDWAAKIPAADGGRIEIRAGYPAPAMK